MLTDGYEASLLEGFSTARLNENRRCVLRRVLQAVQPTAYLSWHVSSANAAVIALANAHAVVHARTLTPRGGGVAQPHRKRAFEVLEGALAAIDLLGGPQPHPGVGAARTVVATIVAGGEQGLETAADCGHFAAQLQVARAQLVAAVDDLFKDMWDQGGTGAALERVAAEVAALCLQHGRTHDYLKEDLVTVLSRGVNSGPAILQTIYSRDRRFRATVIIDGTRKLHAIDDVFRQDAEPHQYALGSAPDGRGHRMPALLQFLQRATARLPDGNGQLSTGTSNGAVVLSFWVTARDHGGAATRSRRRVTEILDQYVAGNRLADLRLRPDTLIYCLQTQRVELVGSQGPRRDSVKPLSTHWPPAIRECLRTAHIASTTEAPMASTGLSWVALESLGLKHREIEQLANALSLLAIRQQLVGVHEGIRHIVKATSLVAGRQQEEAVRTLRALEDGARRAEAAQSKATSVVTERLESLRRTVTESDNELSRVKKVCEESLQALDSYCKLTQWGWLEDLNQWLRLLEPLPSAPTPGLIEARSALSTLCVTIGGLGASEVSNWQSRMANLTDVADWLTACRERFKAMLNWLYVVRNLALHTGSFESASDEMDAYGARALVDMTLEFLGNWYQTALANDPPKAQFTAMQIVEELSTRQQDLIATLRGAAQSKLNAKHLTSPTSTGWDRL